jgi:hypothetical protein
MRRGQPFRRLQQKRGDAQSDLDGGDDGDGLGADPGIA